MLAIANAPYDFSKPETLVFDLENPKPKDLLTMKEAFEDSLKGGVSYRNPSELLPDGTALVQPRRSSCLRHQPLQPTTRRSSTTAF